MKALPPSFQNQILKATLLTEKTSVNRDRAIWVGQIQPLSICDIYTIEVDYTQGKHPKIRVLFPKLRLAKGERKIPHMFNQERLCLFRGINKHWDPSVGFNRNIIPWTSMWLYYYEMWLATGKWMGGGEHPSVNLLKKEKKNSVKQNRKEV